ncbi:hypothetical protein E4Z66_04920 [Aliishimia ponticola]|uniref:EF-hand domain-containing protein n=1 Tax=Aliishimia ponticola TaxID=2499833 RepID=A0A4V3XKZ9_9RHOB|nr:hypothetical protein [Aliishimia ponticola]THH38903.1 hypothetical protein E4Z66_04920 [Aliishimia ponticola]
MFTSLTTRTAAALLLTAGGAFAMSDAAVSADKNGDGMLTIDEIQAAFPDVSTDTFTTIDANADGLLDEAEISAAEEAGILPTGS